MLRKLVAYLTPGKDSWLYRRVALLGSVFELLRCIDIATQKGDAGTVAQLIIGLVGVLGIYTGGAVTDDHLKRKSEQGTTT